MMDKFKNATLDTLAIGAIGTGIALIPTPQLLPGVILVIVGAGLATLKYFLRD